MLKNNLNVLFLLLLMSLLLLFLFGIRLLVPRNFWDKVTWLFGKDDIL